MNNWEYCIKFRENGNVMYIGYDFSEGRLTEQYLVVKPNEVPAMYYNPLIALISAANINCYIVKNNEGGKADVSDC